MSIPEYREYDFYLTGLTRVQGGDGYYRDGGGTLGVLVAGLNAGDGTVLNKEIYMSYTNHRLETSQLFYRQTRTGVEDFYTWLQWPGPKGYTPPLRQRQRDDSGRAVTRNRSSIQGSVRQGNSGTYT